MAGGAAAGALSVVAVDVDAGMNPPPTPGGGRGGASDVEAAKLKVRAVTLVGRELIVMCHVIST